MATFSKYKLYELYETDDGINWIPTGEYKAVLSEMYSEDCGYSARTITETVDDCSGTTKVITTITKYQASYDSGTTWVTTSTTSSVTYEENSPDCGYKSNYLKFTSKSSGTFIFKGSTTENTISYSSDSGETWSTPASSVTVNVNSGDTIFWKGEMTPNGSNGIGSFSYGTALFDVKGNIMSLLYGDYFENKIELSRYAFCDLFSYTKCVSVENLVLPATTLAYRCYGRMFYSCTSLTTPPQLIATTLADSCYEYMFYGCTSLTQAPQLLATTLDYRCYQNMFGNCESLTTAPQLPATTLKISCYEGMFAGCTSLTTAPELLATTLANSCYRSMFGGCTNLNYIKMLATNINASDCLWYWVRNVASSGTFLKAASMTNLPSGASGIPENWTVQNA